MKLPSSTQVLVAGGGPVGLAAAVELGRRGIECLVVEPRTVVSQTRPRCKTINVRSMEHLRRWGIADQLRLRAPLPITWSQDVVFCTSLAGRELSRFTGVLGLAADGDRFPEPGQQAPQYVLEELLRTVVDELDSATLATGTRVVGLDQDADEVHVTITDEAGNPSIVTADYVLGCDGPRSTVRDQIGSAYVGEHALRPNFGMVFRAPELWKYVRHGPAVQYWTVNPGAPALVGPIDRTDTWWIIAFGVEREVGERTGLELIRAAAGAPIEAEILSTDPWTAHMQLVDRIRCGRVFLAGDAAHLNPPFGGHGLNTGLGDAVDLGWKLAAALDGWGGPTLLDSYERERRPIQTRVIDNATANMSVLSSELLADNLDDDDTAGDRARAAAGARIQETKKAEFHALDLVLDLTLDDSPVIVTDEDTPSRRGPTGARAGARLPHVWLDAGVSLYDRLGTGLTLLVLDGEPAAAAMIEHAAHHRGVPITVIDLSDRRLRDRYGANLLLVRPDQYVAWRGDRAPDDPLTLVDRIRGDR
jgi:2-polyprenyl-6-methoxyphenol hydroxylase-like FAD-dependent oxidoreductase